jgi:[acyl-carrier-protein] S-malonyltransferase
MYEAGLARPGTMAAVLGETDPSVDAICAEASASADGGLVVPANYNSPGQVVVSGEVAGVERAMELAREAGARRAIRLAVSGAFHSPLMAPASDAFQRALDRAPLIDPSFPVYANVTTEPVRDAATARRLLLEQLTAPVRWTQLIERVARDLPGAVFIELGPGSVLTSLTRKIVPDAECLTCGTAAEAESLFTRMAA